MNATAILLLSLGTLSVIAAIPQLYTLVQVKESDQFNLFSWVVWFGYEASACAYSYAIHAYAFLFINAIWALFYALMVILILKYRD